MNELSIGTEGDSGPPSVLRLEDYDSQGLRVGIFGASGAGKGWLLGLLLEQFHRVALPIIALDPESELWTLQEIGALVLGGPHGDAPVPQTYAALREVMQYGIDTGTPVVFDLGSAGSEVEDTGIAVQREGIAIMRAFTRMTTDLRTRVVFAVTEAELFAPQVVARSGQQSTVFADIQKRGRKRGVIPIIETQRTADIAKSVISQCNVRFIGHMDEPLDYDAVKRHVTGYPFEAVRGLRTGYFIRTPESVVVRVAPREVTHGGGTPLSGEVQITRRAEPVELAAILDRLRSADTVDVNSDLHGPVIFGGRVPGKTAWLADEELRELRNERDGLRRALQTAQETNTEVIDRWHREQVRADAAEAIVAGLRVVIEATIGKNLAANINMPDGTTFEQFNTNAMTEEQVIDLIRRHAPQGGTGGVSVAPVEALRKDYLERAAERLYETMRQLGDDEREALKYLLVHTTETSGISLNAISVGLTGSDSGSMRNRWTKAVGNLKTAGLVAAHGSGGTQRKEVVNQWIRRGLAGHEATDAEVEQVKSRALSLLLT